jgi:hypothetical protein
MVASQNDLCPVKLEQYVGCGDLHLSMNTMKVGLHNVFSGNHSLTMEAQTVAETLEIYSILI